jgi:hypothetical protein
MSEPLQNLIGGLATLLLSIIGIFLVRKYKETLEMYKIEEGVVAIGFVGVVGLIYAVIGAFQLLSS